MSLPAWPYSIASTGRAATNVAISGLLYREHELGYWRAAVIATARQGPPRGSGLTANQRGSYYNSTRETGMRRIEIVELGPS